MIPHAGNRRLAARHSLGRICGRALGGALPLVLCSACGIVRQPPQPTADELRARMPDAWVTDSSAHFRLHVQRGSAAEPLVPIVAARLEQDLRRVLDVLGESTYASPIDVFVVGSRADMERLTAARTNGIAFYRTNVIGLVVTPSWSASSTHEVLHVVAMNVWGRGESWLNEGLAVHAADDWRGAGVHDAARQILGTPDWVPLGRLLARFRAVEPHIAYPLAGSFVRFLYDAYGREAVERLWREGSGAARRIFGKDLRLLEREWLELLAPDASAGSTHRS